MLPVGWEMVRRVQGVLGASLGLGLGIEEEHTHVLELGESFPIKLTRFAC